MEYTKNFTCTRIYLSHDKYFHLIQISYEIVESEDIRSCSSQKANDDDYSRRFFFNFFKIKKNKHLLITIYLASILWENRKKN